MTGWRWPKFGAGGDDGAIVQSFWYGASLTPYERLSIKSFLDCGHRYRLFAYQADLIVPDGCEIADAAEILPEDRVFFYRRGAGTGSVAAFSNLFRYKLLFERGGWWVDTDVVCQTRRLPGGRYVFGYQPGGEVNSAVMKSPRRARLMRRCLDAATDLGDDVRWGEAGPELLSRLVAEERLERFVRDSRAFYPYDWPEALRALDPRHEFRLKALCVNATFVHLWNEMLRRAGVDKTAPPPEGSYLAGLFARHAVTFDPRGNVPVADRRPAYTSGCRVRLCVLPAPLRWHPGLEPGSGNISRPCVPPGPGLGGRTTNGRWIIRNRRWYKVRPRGRARSRTIFRSMRWTLKAGRHS